MLAALALTVTTSAALTLPLTRNTSLALVTPTNITGSALDPPADIDGSVGFLPWPRTPYYVRLPGTGYTDLWMVVQRAKPVRTSPPIIVPHLQLFIREFADNLRREYPVPGFAPRTATQSTFDVTSNIEYFLWLKEGGWYGRVPMVVALAALDTLEKEVGMHGPADVDYAIQFTSSRGDWSIGILLLEDITGASLNDSLSNENDNLQTA